MELSSVDGIEAIPQDISPNIQVEDKTKSTNADS